MNTFTKKRYRSLFFANEMIKWAAESDDTYSSALRKLNKENPEKVKKFMKHFKDSFDQAMEEKINNPQNVALIQAKTSIASNKNERLVKLAQAMIGTSRSPQEVGMSLGKIIKILMEKLPHDRKSSLDNMRSQISKLDPKQISINVMPETAAYGQSITLIKTLLNGYSPDYIKQVLSAVSGSLY